MRTITNLIEKEKHVYVKFNNEELCRQFMLQAEWEGFTIGKEGKPTDIELTQVIKVKPQKKLSHLVGFSGHMLYHSKQKNVVRIDYERYINGLKKYTF